MTTNRARGQSLAIALSVATAAVGLVFGVGRAGADHAPVVVPDLVPPGLLASHNEASGLSIAPLARALENHRADLFVQHFRVPAGAALGWHTHPGPAIVAVVRGYLGYQREGNGECVTTWYGPGTDPGFGHVHRGIARPDVGFDSYATFVTPPGSPSQSIPMPAPSACS
jgi:hypothetical protein